MLRPLALAALAALAVGLAVACSSSTRTSTGSGGAGGATSTGGGHGGAPATTGTTATAGGHGAAVTSTGPGGGGGTGGSGGGGGAGGGTGGSGGPTAAALLKLTASCKQASAGLYQAKNDPGFPANIPICGLTGAFFWSADMDVDCDGQQSAQCNSNTDPSYQNDTSLHDSMGNPLDAASLPYIVVPLPSNLWDYKAAGVKLGAVVAVLYNGQLAYGVFGDEGPPAIIGEASYAMASQLGINPDPAVGGVDSGVTYIVFSGAGAVVATPEDNGAAVTLGQSLAQQLLQNN